jgi:hypothetical protein
MAHDERVALIVGRCICLRAGLHTGLPVCRCGRRLGDDGTARCYRQRFAQRLDADLDADDWLDAGGLAGLVEAYGAVKPVVVGDRQRGHAHALGGGHQLVDTTGAIAKREVAVHMQVDETHGIT